MDDRLAAAGLRLYPGWIGIHTQDQAAGALSNGTRVRKIKSEPGDTHPIGSLATVLGSLGLPDIGYGYFVEWDVKPRLAVFVIAAKIAAAGG